MTPSSLSGQPCANMGRVANEIMMEVNNRFILNRLLIFLVQRYKGIENGG